MTRTRVEPIQAEVRARILDGRLQPGTKLLLSDLASGLGASVSVVREALIRLVSEGLVTSEPQLGFRVVSISRSDLDDLVEARCVIECEAFRKAMTNGGQEWEARIMAAYHRLLLVQDSGNQGRTDAEWVVAHRQFHEALIEGCGNLRLISTAMALRNSAELYRAGSVAKMTREQSIRRDAEHLALRDAAIARDIEAGAELLRQHIERTAHYFPVGA